MNAKAEFKIKAFVWDENGKPTGGSTGSFEISGLADGIYYLLFMVEGVEGRGITLAYKLAVEKGSVKVLEQSVLRNDFLKGVRIA